MAEQLNVLSGGRIKTGVYHADIAAKAKENLHQAWREGKIKVVCATIGDVMSFRMKFLRLMLSQLLGWELIKVMSALSFIIP